MHWDQLANLEQLLAFVLDSVLPTHGVVSRMLRRTLTCDYRLPLQPPHRKRWRSFPVPDRTFLSQILLFSLSLSFADALPHTPKLSLLSETETAQYSRGALVSSPQVISTAKGASKHSSYGHRDLTGFWHFKCRPPTTFASLPSSASEKLPREPDSSLPPVLSL